MGSGAWWAAVHGVMKSRTQLSDFTFTFHFHALEKEMATHSSALAWRIPGTGKPGGLPSMGSVAQSRTRLKRRRSIWTHHILVTQSCAGGHLGSLQPSGYREQCCCKRLCSSFYVNIFSSTLSVHST